MNIAYSSSDSYAQLAGISILSLFENNKDCDEINVFILDNNISDKNKDKLLSLAEKYDRYIKFVEMIDLKELTGVEVSAQRWNLSTFGRLFEASLFPELDKIMHIDCDTIICDSLEEYWNQDMTGKVYAGALENIGYKFKRDIGLSETDSYMNAGNVMLNLKYIRENNVEKRFVDYIIKRDGKLAFVDQEVLNGSIREEEKLVLSLRFNSYSIIHYFDYKQSIKIKKVRGYYDECEYNEAVNNPSIVHFTTCFLDGTRPWIEGNKHPYLSEFLKYKALSPWKDEPLWKDERSALKKIFTKISNIMPRWLMLSIFGFLHNEIVRSKYK